MQIAALTTDDKLFEMLRASSLKIDCIDAVDFAKYSRQSQAPAVVILDIRREAALPAGMTEFRKQHPDCALMLVMTTLEPRLMLEGIRAGVSECLAEPLTQEAVSDALRRIAVETGSAPAGQVVAFVGAKGGVGTTTLAVNTAATLARVSTDCTLLMDLHIVHGDAALFLGCDPRFSVVDAIENVHRIDESFLSGVVEKAKCGVHLLASSNRSLHGSVDSSRMRRLLEFAASKYRFTVLDVPRSDFTMLDALDPVTTIMVVTNQEVSALRSAALTAGSLRQRYGAQRVRVVINRFDKQSVVERADIERVVGEPVRSFIPSDYRLAVEAVNTGRPIILEKDAKLAKALRLFARDIAGVKAAEAPSQSSGVLSRLAWRRA